MALTKEIQKHTRKQFTLAELTQGLDVIIQGDPSICIDGVCSIEDTKPNCITLLTNSALRKYLPTVNAAAVILAKRDASLCPVQAIISRDPHYTYAKIAAYFDTKPQPEVGIHPTAVLGQDCQLGTGVCIGAYCILGNNVTLGDHVVIGPGSVVGDDTHIADYTRLDANVTVYFKTKIGQRVIISSGTVIGSDGFGNAKHDGGWQKVPQLGNVVIGDDVEIGANCTIDRGAIGDTVIAEGVRLDNLIQIAHNVHIGRHTAIAACVGIAGSTRIGANCLIGGGVGITGHVTIADDVMVTGMTAVTKTIHQPGIYSSGVGGVVPNLQWRKNSARLHRLEHLTARIKDLENAVKNLQQEMTT